MGQQEEALHELVSQAAITNDDLATLRRCLAELRTAVSMISPAWRVKPFGSAVNGFGSRGWDLDATCALVDATIEEEDRAWATEDLRQRLPLVLQKHPLFEFIEEVTSARIPLLKLRFNQILEVDLSFHNLEPLANTHLLRAYATLHWYIREVAVLVKLWAKFENVCGAKTGHLSAYALTMMTIYFMQVDPRVQVPCIDTSLFNGLSAPPEITEQWSTSASLLKLLTWFFEFYASIFWWGEEVVSVRLGERRNVSDECFKTLRGRSPYPTLHIEDPFLLHRNLNCVLGQVQEQLLYAKICEAYQALNAGMLPTGLQLAGRSFTEQDAEYEEEESDTGSSADSVNHGRAAPSFSSHGYGDHHSGLLMRSSHAPQPGHPTKLMMQPQFEPPPHDPQLLQALKKQQQRQRRRQWQKQRPKWEHAQQQLQHPMSMLGEHPGPAAPPPMMQLHWEQRMQQPGMLPLQRSSLWERQLMQQGGPCWQLQEQLQQLEQQVQLRSQLWKQRASEHGASSKDGPEKASAKAQAKAKAAKAKEKAKAKAQAKAPAQRPIGMAPPPMPRAAGLTAEPRSTAEQRKQTTEPPQPPAPSPDVLPFTKLSGNGNAAMVLHL